MRQTQQKFQIYVENMYARYFFGDQELQAWENKATTDKTWVNVKAYFVPLYKSKAHFKDEHATHQGVLERSNTLAQYTTGKTMSRASIINHKSSQPPTIITTMSPSDHQTSI